MELNYRKLFIAVLKIIPLLIALSYVLYAVFLFFATPIGLGWLFGTSLITTVFMIIASYTFKFCEYHRIFLYYSFAVELFKQFIKWQLISITNLGCLLLIIISFFLVFCIALYQHLKQNEHNK